MISTVLNDIANNFLMQPNMSQVAISAQPELSTTQDAAPKILMYPIRANWEGPDTHLAGTDNTRTIRVRRVVCEFDIWGVPDSSGPAETGPTNLSLNTDGTEILLNNLLVAINNSTPGNYKVLSEKWNTGAVEAKFGRYVQLQVEFKVAVSDIPVLTTLATITGEAITEIVETTSAGEDVLVIPETVNVLGHWTANDLAFGRAHKGPVWTRNGTIPYNSVLAGNFPRVPFVGPFTDSNYLSLLPGNIFDRTTSFSMAMVVYTVDQSNNPVMFSVGGVGSGSGWSAECLPISTQSNDSLAGGFQSNNYSTYAGANPAGQVHLVQIGYDAPNSTAYFAVDSIPATHYVTALSASSQQATLGRWSNGPGFSYNGYIYEVMLSSDTPSTAFFEQQYQGYLSLGGANPPFGGESPYILKPYSSVPIIAQANMWDLATNNLPYGGLRGRTGSPNWNIAGLTVPFRPASGPYDDSDYYTLTANPFNLTSSFAYALVLQYNSLSGPPVVIGCGNQGVDGWYAAPNEIDINTPANHACAGSAPPTGTPIVQMGGWDATGKIAWTTYNNLTPTTISVGSAIVSSAQASTIGKYPAGSGRAFNGLLYEFLMTSDTPSAALFAQWYQNFLTNGAHR